MSLGLVALKKKKRCGIQEGTLLETIAAGSEECQPHHDMTSATGISTQPSLLCTQHFRHKA